MYMPGWVATPTSSADRKGRVDPPLLTNVRFTLECANDYAIRFPRPARPADPDKSRPLAPAFASPLDRTRPSRHRLQFICPGYPQVLTRTLLTQGAGKPAPTPKELKMNTDFGTDFLIVLTVAVLVFVVWMEYTHRN